MNNSSSAQNPKTEIIHSPFAADEEQPYIFISYAHADRERIFPIITRLYEQGWRIWYDQGLEIGGNYEACLSRHIKSCEVFLLFVTKVSVTRDYVVEKELQLAGNTSKPIIQCILDADAEFTGDSRDIIDIVTANRKRNPVTDEAHLEEVLAVISGLERGEPRKAIGIKINEPAELADTALSDGDEYRFIVVNGGIRLTRYLGSDTEVVIPSIYKGKRVVELERTFKSNENIQSMTRPIPRLSIPSTLYSPNSRYRRRTRNEFV